MGEGRGGVNLTECPLCDEAWPCPKHHDEWNERDGGNVGHDDCARGVGFMLHGGGWFCPECGRLDREWRFRGIAPASDDGFDCDECGHRHAGSNLASICIGCPCPVRRVSASPDTTGGGP